MSAMWRACSVAKQPLLPVGVTSDPSSEVANELKLLRGLKQGRAHAVQVEPSRAAQTRIAEAVVEVEPIDVGDQPLCAHNPATVLDPVSHERDIVCATPPG